MNHCWFLPFVHYFVDSTCSFALFNFSSVPDKPRYIILRITTDVISSHKNCVLAQCIILVNTGGWCVCWVGRGGGVKLELGPCKMHFLVLLLDIFSSGDEGIGICIKYERNEPL